MQPEIILERLLKRNPESTKADYGHVLVIAGSRGLTGAATLCAMAALRFGSGLVTVICPESCNDVLEVKLTEAMTCPVADTGDGHIAFAALEKILDVAQKCTVAVLGPGLGLHAETQALVRELVRQWAIPVVLDADGLNAFKDLTSDLLNRKGELILTPHRGEYARLFAERSPEKVLSDKSEQVLVLKSHRTEVFAGQKKIYTNTTGNPAMAKGGMGDVLAGMIAAFRAQGLSAAEAAVLAVHEHGKRGDEVLKSKGMLGVLPSDFLL